MRSYSEMTVAVLGAGTMGSGIAEAAARAGHPVLLIDLNPDVLERSCHALHKSLDALVAKQRMDRAERNAVFDRIRWVDSIDAVAEAGLVVEAIVERLDAKVSLLKKIERLVSSHAVMATNTSSLSVEAMAEALVNPHRFLGLHFFNPVPAMRLVEIIPAAATSAEVLEAMTNVMLAWGKSPVRVKDVPGFIVNRVARPFYAEAFRAWGEGLEPASVDALIVGSGGFRMGPLALADLIGHDINYAAAVSVHEAYEGQTRFRPQHNQELLVDQALLGRKSGRGVFDYSQPIPPPAFIAPLAPPVDVWVPSSPGDLDVLLNRISETRSLSVDPSLAQGVMRIGDVTLSMTDGRTLAARPDCSALLDVARDARTAPVFGVTAINAASASAVAGLLSSVGARAIQEPDWPGMLVLRTLSQLASAAIDAVTDGVATPQDIGLAMTLGANHPESPLAWASRLGPRLHVIQRHIADVETDPIYAPVGAFLKDFQE